MTNQKHTPLPWELKRTPENRYKIIKGDLQVASTGIPFWYPESEANAEFIVKCVNNHYKLLEACKEALSNSLGEMEKGQILRQAIKDCEG